MNVRMSPSLQQAQKLAATAQILAIVALIILGINIAVPLGRKVTIAVFATDPDWREHFHAIGLVLITLMPAMLFFEAINQLRQALKLFGSGEFFTESVATRVQNAGHYAIGAMMAIIVVVPNLELWVNRRGGFDVNLENEYIGMLAFAMFVAAIGHIMAAATELKTENESFV
jgi:cytochrome c biogenesis protein CcdA